MSAVQMVVASGIKVKSSSVCRLGSSFCNSRCVSFRSQQLGSQVPSLLFIANASRVRTSGVVTCTLDVDIGDVRLIVQGKHMQLTEPIRKYVEDKTGHAIHKQLGLVREVDVRLSTRGGDVGKGPKLQRCEVTIYTKKHGVIRAEEEAVSLYAAIDEVADVVSRKLRKVKERDGGHGRTWQMRHATKLGEMLVTENTGITASDTDVIEQALNKPAPADPVEDEIVRRKFFEMVHMTPEDAIVQLKNVGHDFYAFRDIGSGEVHIVYKRKHGGFGLIIPRPEANMN